MIHSATMQKKRKIFSIAGLIVILLGVVITFRALSQNTEQRRFAQNPITYPQTDEKILIAIPQTQLVPPTDVMTIPAFTPSATTLNGRVFNTSGYEIPIPSRFSMRWKSSEPSIVGVDNELGNSVVLSGNNFGYSTIQVELIDSSTKAIYSRDEILVKSGTYWNMENYNQPECTIVAFSDEAKNSPPNYNLRNKITTIQPEQIFVLATNFNNKTGKQYQHASNHIALGKYLQFVDSNGENCSYDQKSQTIICDHGMFLHDGATSMAFRVRYTGSQPVPVSVFGTTFTNNGDTGSCSILMNNIP